MAELQWTALELQTLEALGLSITPHSDPNLGWGYTWRGRDWVGPLPTPDAAIHAASTEALLALKFRSTYSWVDGKYPTKWAGLALQRKHLPSNVSTGTH